ncbi:hypothetical protein RFZ55_20700, partial [Acinetobacter baumannii]|nr:hypothetical protein [Acinetobacter baumannii]
PMAPHTAWEWMEFYGAVQTSEKVSTESYELALKDVNCIVEKTLQDLQPEKKLADTKSLAKQSAKLLQSGNGYGALENALRTHKGEA